MPAQHILLVEDDPDLLSLLTEVLEDEGYRVTAASRRDQARRALRKSDVDLLVADSVLRGGNGDDVAKSASRRGLPDERRARPDRPLDRRPVAISAEAIPRYRPRAARQTAIAVKSAEIGRRDQSAAVAKALPRASTRSASFSKLSASISSLRRLSANRVS